MESIYYNKRMTTKHTWHFHKSFGNKIIILRLWTLFSSTSLSFRSFVHCGAFFKFQIWKITNYSFFVCLRYLPLHLHSYEVTSLGKEASGCLHATPTKYHFCVFIPTSADFVFPFQLHVEQPDLVSAFPFFVLGSFLLPLFVDPTLPLRLHRHITAALPSLPNPSPLSTRWNLLLIPENAPFRTHRLLAQQVPIARPKLHQACALTNIGEDLKFISHIFFLFCEW